MSGITSVCINYTKAFTRHSIVRRHSSLEREFTTNVLDVAEAESEPLPSKEDQKSPTDSLQGSKAKP